MASIMTAVGIDDNVKMNYSIWIAKFDTNGDVIPIADTESFKRGVSVSSISWGFSNPGAYGGDRDVAKISITLHDIAGGLIGDIMKLHSMAYWIYFQGPTSLGDMWPGEPAIYIPIKDECKIEFSDSTGFTYTIGGIPMCKFSSSPIVANKQEFTLTGLEKDGISDGSTFETYITKHLVNRWNSFIVEDQQKPSATIKIETEPHILMQNTVQVRVKNNDGKSGKLEPFLVPVGATVPDVIRRLFSERFKKMNDDIQTSTKGAAGKRPNLEVNFKKWEGNVVTYYVRFSDSLDTKSVITSGLNICIGSDENCAGAQYRGKLAGMNFGELASLMSFQVNIVGNGEATSKNSPINAQGGNVAIDLIKGEQEDDAGGDSHKNLVETPLSANVIETSNGTWGAIDAVLNAHKVPNFSIDIELPYSFGFSPEIQGGLLKDAVPGSNGAGIHVNQGASLDFYWYVDPNCAELAKQPGISNDYRLASVSHTIGLNGNSTQIKLSTLNLS